VGIPRRGLNLREAQQYADHGQALAGGLGGEGEGVALIVDSNALQAGARGPAVKRAAGRQASASLVIPCTAGRARPGNARP
jgi:hypothetical protein